MCAGTIGWAQIGRVVYGAADEKRATGRSRRDRLSIRGPR